jgi:hypothetical protein
MDYSRNLPNFICTQITDRETSSANNSKVAVTGSGLSRAGIDPAVSSSEVEERLSYIGRQDHYKVIAINGKRVAGTQHMELAGAVSAGEFGTALQVIFDPESHTVFTWDRTASLRRRPVDIFAFEVPSPPGASVIDEYLGRQITASYCGRIFVDQDTKEVMRITSHLNLPADFPVQLTERTVDYRGTGIAGQSYFLPFRSEVLMQERGVLRVNRIDFKDYLKFAVESVIHYDNGELD